MTRNFQSWEKDPFFFAAEQVQDSADRLESAYRAWMHVKGLSLDAQDSSTLNFCRRELSTALGIAKWQLEEFEKEGSLRSDTQQQHADDDAPQRHSQFIDAISNQISCIKNALLCSNDERDEGLPAVCLGQEESDQFAHFLCGSRLRTCEDAKDMLSSCTSPGKGYKEMAKSCQSATSMSSSGLDCGKGLFGSLDECSTPPDTHISVGTNEPCISKDRSVNKREIHWATVMDTDFLCINVDQSNKVATCAATDLLIGDCNNSVGTCIERPNGHHRSNSLGGSLNFCTERPNGHLRTASVDAGLSCGKVGSSSSEYKTSHKQAMSHGLSNIWHSILKASLIFQVGASSSNGLKRWKDGECDAIDPCKILQNDIEQDCSIFLCQDGSWSEMQTSQSFRKGLSFRRLIQATSAILAVVGLLCLYFH